ncbi:MAG: DNA primase small subunit domain-containing protein, partial [Candidatus Woesearchaeota archaeon]
MFIAKALSHYKRIEVQKKIAYYSKDKEIAVRFNTYFGKRPDVITYPNDVLEFAKKKASSFHCSEELWTNPLMISSDMKKHEIEDLRKGWDLILDIDCKHFIYSKIATHILVKIIKDLGINSVTCKFSGNKGFHIAVPFEAFPEYVGKEPTKNLFPEAPRKIAHYLRDKLQPLLEKAILKIEKGSLEKISKRTGIPYEELMVKDEFSKINENKLSLNTDAFLEIDTILIASRHLYRMPYSLHEKSGLVSVPVDTNKILRFKKEMAKPEKIEFELPFLDRDAKKGEANALLINAYDFRPTRKQEVDKDKEYEMPTEAIPEEFFPPTIHNILQGLEDGKKRALFTIINFLKGCGWPHEAIKQKIYAWNEKNPEPLREVYLKGQLNQAKKQKKVIPPHNYPGYGENYYK